MHPRTTFSFYQTILAIGYHPVDINKDVIKLLFTVRDCHSLVSDMGGGGSNQKMTKCDMGGGGGVKNHDFRSDILFAWPLTVVILFHESMQRL